MHTAIYVFKPSTVTIRARTRARSIYLHRYGAKPVAKTLGALRLRPGIYMAVSRGALEVTGEHAAAAALRGTKDEWPDPPADALALAEGATRRRVIDFFNDIIKGGDV